MKITGTGPGPTAPGAAEIRVSPDGTRAFVSLQNKHIVVPIPRVGDDVVKISVHGDGDSVVPIKRLSREGGNYLSWSPDGKAVVWALGNTIYRQALSADTPEAFHPVVEAPRAKPHGHDRAHRRAHRHDEGRRGHREGRRRHHRQPHRGRRTGGTGEAAGRREGDRRLRQDDHPRLRGRALAHVAAARRPPDAGLAVPREPRVRRDHDARSADVDRRRVRLLGPRADRRHHRPAHPRDRAGHLQQLRAGRQGRRPRRSSSATRRTTRPTRSRSTSRAIGSCGSG